MLCVNNISFTFNDKNIEIIVDNDVIILRVLRRDHIITFEIFNAKWNIHTSGIIIDINPTNITSCKIKTIQNRFYIENSTIHKKYIIVTITNRDIKQINDRHDSDMYYTFNRFIEYFDIIDIRGISDEILSTYDIILLDMVAIYTCLKLSKITIKFIYEMLVGNKNTILLLHDLHNWSFFPLSLPSEYKNGLYPMDIKDIGYSLLDNFINKLDIKTVISLYDCSELQLIATNTQIENIFVVPHHINNNIFNDYKYIKKYDIFFYGSCADYVYPFRNRIKNILKKSNLNVMYAEHEFKYDDEICGIGLAKKINSAWLSVATSSNFDYLVKKYFEISACNTVILGNMPIQGNEIWNENYISINNAMSDEDIVQIINECLDKKEYLRNIAQKMYNKIQAEYTIQCHIEKIYSICNALNNKDS